jgi:DNA-binding CsgD family transcriptional regulator
MARSAKALELLTHTVLVDGAGTIVDVQSQGPEGARKSSPLAHLRGRNYLAECSPPIRSIVGELLARKRQLICVVMPPPALGLDAWFAVVGVPADASNDGGGLLIHLDLTPFAAMRDNASEVLRGLSPSLVQEAVTKAFAIGASPAKPLRSENLLRNYEGIESLSPRQREVLMLIGTGKSNVEIAEALSCSLNTVKRHVTAVLQKLKLPNRTRAAMLINQLDPAK